MNKTVRTPTIEEVKNAITDANELKSKLPDRLRTLEGNTNSSIKTRCLLNNLVIK